MAPMYQSSPALRRKEYFSSIELCRVISSSDRCLYAVAIMCPDLPPKSDAPPDEPTDADDARLRAAARLLVAAIASEPVPDRLRLLAAELGKALDCQKREKTAGDAVPPA